MTTRLNLTRTLGAAFMAVVLAAPLAPNALAAPTSPPLLLVDVLNFKNFTITGTGAPALASVNGLTTDQGVTLLNFFLGNNLTNTGLTSNAANTTLLTSSALDAPFNNTGTGDENHDGVWNDFALYSFFARPLSFVTGESAFTGTFGPRNYNFIALTLPPVGATGNIIGGYSTATNNYFGSGGATPVVIGTWMAIPEPSTYALWLSAASLVAVTFTRRRH